MVQSLIAPDNDSDDYLNNDVVCITTNIFNYDAFVLLHMPIL